MPRHPLQTVERVNLEKAVKVLELAGAVAVIERVIEFAAVFSQLGLDKLMKTVLLTVTTSAPRKAPPPSGPKS